MANGRVIARSAGDTATGAFTCVVRRAFFGDRSRYVLTIENRSASVANVAVTRGEDGLQTSRVPGRSEWSSVFWLPRSDVPIGVVVGCDGASISLLEHVANPADETSRRERQRLAVTVMISAACSAAVVASLGAGVWFFVLRRFFRDVARPPAPHEPMGLPVAEPVERGAKEELTPQEEPVVPDDEPPVSPSGLEDGATPQADEPYEPMAISELPDVPETVEVLSPEPVRVTPFRESARRYEAPRRRRNGAGIALVVLLAAGALIGGFVFAHPHIGELGAPNTVLEGSAVDVPYASSGMGTLRYTVVSSRGDTIASGPLADRSGVLHLVIPSLQHNEAYRVRLTMSGPLGDASNEATIGASALPATRVLTRTTASPLIRSFAISRSTANNVAALVAFYDVIADSGTLRLIDTRGIQYQQSPLSPTGQTKMTLPPGVDPGTLALELHAVRNGAAIDSRIGLPAGGTDVAVASPPPDPSASPGDEPPIAVANRAVGSAPIRVQIVHHYPNLHVALLDENARKIIGIDVPRGASSIALTHPPVSATTRMTVEATYNVNDESDTVLRPVLVSPAGG